MTFSELNLIEPILRAVQQEGYTTPTPIQQQAIPHVLAGRDLIACAQTGTGKTAAFALPLIQHLSQGSGAADARPAQARGDRRDDRRPRRRIRALVLSPTRELALQILESFNAYGRYTGLKATVIYGGVGQNPQVQAMRAGVDVLIATPGRLLDLMGQGYVRLEAVERFVLDEADRMLDMGFIHDVRRIIAALPAQRQTLLFSATMPAEIQALADDILNQPVRVEVTPPATTVEKIAQSVYFVAKRNKRALLEHLLDDAAIRRALVFTRTKHGANKLAEQLEEANIMAEAIHGNKSQTAREKALSNFKSGMTRVLVATDIAARGIDVDDVTHVINFDLPYEPESYVHRIGRTARAGASGIAFSFCDEEEFRLLRDIQRLIRIDVPVADDHPYALPKSAYEEAVRGGAPGAPRRFGSRPNGNNSSGNRSNGGSARRGAPQQGERRSGDSRRGDAPSAGRSERSEGRSPDRQYGDNRAPGQSAGRGAASGDAPRGEYAGGGETRSKRRRRRQRSRTAEPTL
jgi:ATP-dependent RNA helicase RhlE